MLRTVTQLSNEEIHMAISTRKVFVILSQQGKCTLTLNWRLHFTLVRMVGSKKQMTANTAEVWERSSAIHH